MSDAEVLPPSRALAEAEQARDSAFEYMRRAQKAEERAASHADNAAVMVLVALVGLYLAWRMMEAVKQAIEEKAV